MAIEYKILGEAFKDNALFVKIDTGNKVYKFLLDCGQDCLNSLSNKEISEVDHLLISHFHMDHIAGFEEFFRLNYKRKDPVNVSGPAETIRIMGNRFNGYIWNLIKGQKGEWAINELTENEIIQASYYPADCFSEVHKISKESSKGIVFENNDLIIKYIIMDHKTPVIGYLIEEKEKQNINEEVLKKMGLKSSRGPWLEKLKNMSIPDNDLIQVDGKDMLIGKLRKDLILKTKGESIVYLTDFIRSEDNLKKITDMTSEPTTLVCESQYLNKDIELAEANYHQTVSQAANIAKQIKAEKLILYHLSPRYNYSDFQSFLKEAKKIFSNTYLPEHWIKKQ